MTGDPVFDSKMMFRHASEFVDCACFCLESMDTKKGDYTVPSIVNAVFACEVFIKALLLFNGASVKEIKASGHTINKLWNTLCNKDANTVKRIYDKLLLEYHSSIDELRAMIEEIADAFVKWRYCYETNGTVMELTFLYSFTDALRESCCEIIFGITWDEYICREQEQA